MMNELERLEMEAENDGCRNEFQRAMAVSSANRPGDQRVKALGLVQDGRFVAVAIAPVYCRYTDGVIGDFVSILGDFANRSEAEACINAREWDAEEVPQVWPLRRV